MLQGGGTSDLTLAHLNFWPVSSLTLLTGRFKFGLGVSLLFLLTVLFLHSSNLAPQPFGIVAHASAVLKQSLEWCLVMIVQRSSMPSGCCRIDP